MMKKLLLVSLLLVVTNAQAMEEATKSVLAGIVGGYSLLQAHRKYPENGGKAVKELNGKFEKLLEENKKLIVKNDRLDDAQIDANNAQMNENYAQMRDIQFNAYAPSIALTTVASVSRVATVVLFVKKLVEIAKAEDKKAAAKAAFNPKKNKKFTTISVIALASGIADVAYGRSFNSKV